MKISWVKTVNMPGMMGCLIMPSTHSWQTWLSSVAVRFNTWNNYSFPHNQLYAVPYIILSTLIENDHDIRSAEVKFKEIGVLLMRACSHQHQLLLRQGKEVGGLFQASAIECRTFWLKQRGYPFLPQYRFTPLSPTWNVRDCNSTWRLEGGRLSRFSSASPWKFLDSALQ
jgi:hypothetical protein